jgi:LPS sulfotransferase NodH
MGKRELLILRKAASYYPAIIALKVRLIEGHSDYSKYIILGAARTGSNLLRSLLNSHSGVIAFGELFRNDKRIGWDLPGYFQNKKAISMIQTDPIGFLRNSVFVEYPKRISAVGFKLFYDHAQSTEWKPIWPFLRNQDDLRIIHLKRKNILRRVLSLQRAMSTGRWVSRSQTALDNLPITLDYNRCLNVFKETRDSEQRFDKYFENNSRIDVFYEDLSRDYTLEMKRVQEFLGVPCQFVKPSVYRQSSESLSSAILNYHETKERFQNTPWEEFFEE